MPMSGRCARARRRQRALRSRDASAPPGARPPAARDLLILGGEVFEPVADRHPRRARHHERRPRSARRGTKRTGHIDTLSEHLFGPQHHDGQGHPTGLRHETRVQPSTLKHIQPAAVCNPWSGGPTNSPCTTEGGGAPPLHGGRPTSNVPFVKPQMGLVASNLWITDRVCAHCGRVA